MALNCNSSIYEFMESKTLLMTWSCLGKYCVWKVVKMTNSSAISYDKFVRMTNISVSIKEMKCAKTEMSSYQIYGGPIGFLSW